MSDSPRVAHPRPAPWPLAARTAVAIIVASLCLLAAACGSSAGGRVAQLGSTTTSNSATLSAASTQEDALLAFAACMRSHGVANFPDPDGNGVFPKHQLARLAASSLGFVPAHKACEHLLPNAGQPTQAQVQQAWSDMRSFARCMRSHGVTNWPDPAVTSPQDNRPFFDLPTSIDPNVPEVSSEIRGCRRVMHANNPLVTTQ